MVANLIEKVILPTTPEEAGAAFKKISERFISQETYVYCTHCKHLNYLNFGTPDVTPICIHESECDIWDHEDGRKLWQRPFYEEKS